VEKKTGRKLGNGNFNGSNGHVKANWRTSTREKRPALLVFIDLELSLQRTWKDHDTQGYLATPPKDRFPVDLGGIDDAFNSFLVLTDKWKHMCFWISYKNQVLNAVNWWKRSKWIK
jgi:hypothetical protein